MIKLIKKLTLALLFLTACSTQPQKPEKSPMRLLLGDGGVRIEKSYSHAGKKDRDVAMFKNEPEKFKAHQKNFHGKVWVDEASEYQLLPGAAVECSIEVSRKELKRKIASQETEYIYELRVKVKDGLMDHPFETIINGESEGLIRFGEYPVNSFHSAENLILNETVIPSWTYEPDRFHYEIVKKMGEDRFLKKTLQFDRYLKHITSIKYQILSGSGEEQVDQQMLALAKLNCTSLAFSMFSLRM